MRILNGAHTGFVLGAYLAGYDIVRDCMHDDTILGYMNKMLLDEVVPIAAPGSGRAARSSPLLWRTASTTRSSTMS